MLHAHTVRMVNGLVDPSQTTLRARSVLHIATQLNLPRVLVDIRHEATHNKLPSLPLLDDAAVQVCWGV